MIIMLASDICRCVIREQPPGLLSRLQQWSEQGEELVISAITYAELIAGVLLTGNHTRHLALVEEFCERLEDVMPWDRGAVDSYTAIQLQAMQSGQTLNMNDAMVAAHALSLQAALFTLNPRPFTDIPGLRVDTWQQ